MADLFTPRDFDLMRRCLQLAQRGVTTPNPKVGCVVLDAQGRLVGEGYHVQAGQPHAEVMALEQAGESARGGTLYVNLEPCNHHGRTPPCTQAIKKAGLETVICGTLDPNPKVAGSGRNALQNARITVRSGVLEAECEALNAPFFHAMRTGMPYVTLKVAMTLDGKLAPANGQRHWLTGDLSRQYVHQLRHHHDAILSTAATVLADNAQLTVRDVPGGPLRQPVRVILDRHNRLGDIANLALWQDDAPVWRILSRRYQPNAQPDDVTDDADSVIMPYRDQDKILYAHDTGTGLDLGDVFRQLGHQGLTTVMVEAGGTLAGNVLASGIAHQLVTIQVPQAFLANMAVGLAADTPTALALPASFHAQHRFALAQDWVTVWQPHG